MKIDQPTNRPIDQPTTSKPTSDRLTTYDLALAAVAYLDEALCRDYPRLVDNNGNLIRTLDEAVRALESKNLVAIGEKHYEPSN